MPKKGGAKDLKDFRSISLVGELYKLLAKVLANRLKKVVDNLMSDFQNAFVVGKQILDVVSLIPNLKATWEELFAKLDIEKAYNHVDWSFILVLLDKMGFGAKWIS